MILAAFALVTAPIALPADLNVKTEVAGQVYRVRVKGRAARVYSKAARASPTPETREAMKIAARQVTGCEMIDPYFINAHLAGLLDCGAR